MSPARNVAAAILLLLTCACGKPPNCDETLNAKITAIRAFGTYPTEEQIHTVLGDPSDEGVATGAIVQKFGETGCSDVVAILYSRAVVSGTAGYLVALGRESTDWSKFPGVGDALNKM